MKLITSVRRFLIRYEWLLFAIAVVIIVSDIFANKWLLTEDGGSHLYNAVIMKELLSSDPFIQQHYVLNHLPIPNLLGYVLMLFFNSFLPLSVCDQLIHLLCIAGLCYAFRYLVSKINPAKKYHSWLIFPFVYSTIFCFGFYNYSLGIALCFLSMGIWISMENNPVSKKRIALLLFCCTLLYFTHMLPFILFIIISGMRILFFIRSNGIRESLKKCAMLTLVLLPGFVFYLVFHFSRPSKNRVMDFPDFNFVLTNLTELKLFIPGTGQLAFVMQLLSYVLFLGIIISICLFVIRRKQIFTYEKNNFIFWGMCWALMTFLAFITPDGFGGGSVVTIRLLEISSLFLIVWLAGGILSTRVYFVLGAFAFTIAGMQMQHRKDELQYLNHYAHSVENLAQYVEEGHTGIYIALVANWKELHIGEVLFAKKKCVSLSNYEAYHDYFPVQWNDKMPYNYLVGGLSSWRTPCLNVYWPEHSEKPNKNIDYILMGITSGHMTDPNCFNVLSDSINKNYNLVKKEGDLYLYRSKNFYDHAK